MTSKRSQFLLDTGILVDHEGNEIRLPSSSTSGAIQLLHKLILHCHAKNTLEIGLASGTSALAMLYSLKLINDGEYSHTAIDPYQHTIWKKAGINLIEEEELSPAFECINEFSSTALPRLLIDKRKFDLIYIDGSHLFEDVFVDFYYSLQLLPLNGILLFDDCTDKHVRKVIKFIKNNYSEFLKPFTLQKDSMPKKSLHKQLANALGYSQSMAFTKVKDPPRAWDSPFRNF